MIGHRHPLLFTHEIGCVREEPGLYSPAPPRVRTQALTGDTGLESGPRREGTDERSHTHVTATPPSSYTTVTELAQRARLLARSASLSSTPVPATRAKEDHAGCANMSMNPISSCALGASKYIEGCSPSCLSLATWAWNSSWTFAAQTEETGQGRTGPERSDACKTTHATRWRSSALFTSSGLGKVIPNGSITLELELSPLTLGESRSLARRQGRLARSVAMIASMMIFRAAR